MQERYARGRLKERQDMDTDNKRQCNSQVTEGSNEGHHQGGHERRDRKR